MAPGAGDADDPPAQVEDVSEDVSAGEASAERAVDYEEPTAEEIAERVDTYAETARLATARKRALLAIALSPVEPHTVCDWRCECCGSASAWLRGAAEDCRLVQAGVRQDSAPRGAGRLARSPRYVERRPCAL